MDENEKRECESLKNRKMKCFECGHLISDKEDYCSSCNTKLFNRLVLECPLPIWGRACPYATYCWCSIPISKKE